MPVMREPDEPSEATFEGGPMDGGSWGELEADELEVVMSDGQRHRYVRTGEIRRVPAGSLAHVFQWVGRVVGLR